MFKQTNGLSATADFCRYFVRDHFSESTETTLGAVWFSYNDNVLRISCNSV